MQVKGLIKLILLVLPIILILVYLIFIHLLGGGATIVGGAMDPNFVNREAYIVNPFIYKFSDPKREDVVIVKVLKNSFESESTNNQTKTKAIKRVIGLPGEELEFNNGYVYINGQKLDESYLKNQGATFSGEKKNIQVPTNGYFLIGDNRTESTDSRIYGSIPKQDIAGKVLFCYLRCKN